MKSFGAFRSSGAVIRMQAIRRMAGYIQGLCAATVIFDDFTMDFVTIVASIKGYPTVCNRIEDAETLCGTLKAIKRRHRRD